MKKTVSELMSEVNPPPRVRELTVRNHQLEAQVATLKSKIGELENFQDALREQVVALPNPRRIEARKPHLTHSESQAVLVLADWHGEEHVDAEEMEGYASFDWETLVARAKATAEKTAELTDIMRGAGPVDKCTVLCAGDMVTGCIHADLDRTSTFSLPNAVVRIAQQVGLTVQTLAAHFQSVDVWCVCGNHGRQDEKPVAKQRADRNWDTAVYQIAGLFATSDRVLWHIPRSPSVLVEVLGARILLKHGDNVRMQGTTPFYGMVRDSAQEHRKRKGRGDFDSIVQAHLHSFGVVEERILAPSLIGTNEYAWNRLHSVPRPAQLLMFSNAKHGIINYWPIRLE